MQKIVQQFTGKVYPDYSFSVGKLPTEKKRQAERDYDREFEQQFDEFSEIRSNGVERYVHREKFFTGYDSSNRFIKCSQSSQNFKPYGRKGLTRLGKKTVKNCAVLLERKYGIKRIGFITATLPNYSRRILHILSRMWQEVIRRFFQMIRRFQLRTGVSTHLVCCTEIQPKRYKKTGCIAPHVHFLYVCRTRAHSKKFTILAGMFRRFWQQAIEQVIALVDGEVSEKPAFKASIDAQVVKRSASGYLAKYMSKGGSILETIHEDGMEAFLPKQWWTASNDMKQMLKEAIIHLDNATCNFLFYNLGDCLADGWLTWCNYVDVEINGENRIVGCVGTFSQEYYNLLEEK